MSDATQREPLAGALVGTADPVATERISALLMAADEAFFAVDLRTGEISVSRSLEVAFGHRAADLGAAAQAWMTLVDPADLPAVTAGVREALASGAATWEGELGVRAVDGARRPIRCRMAIVRDGTGTPTLLIGAVTDSGMARSDRKQLQTVTHQALEILARSERKDTRHQLVESVVDEAIWEWDVASGAVRLGGAMHLMFGYDPTELASLEWWDERVHPEDRAGAREGLESVLASDLSEWIGTYRFRRADGAYVWVRDRAYVERGPDGRPLHVIGAARVIEDRDLAATVRRPTVRLSPRQSEVLDLVRAGLTNKQVAARLGIAEQSVKDHVSRLLERFGASNRAALVAATSAVDISRSDAKRRRGTGLAALFALMRGPEHVLVGASPAVLALIPGRSPIGAPVRSAYPQLAGQGVFELLDVVYTTGQGLLSERFRARFYRDDSFVSVTVDLHLEPIRDVRGAVDGVLAWGEEVGPRGRSSGGSGLKEQMESLERLPIGAVLLDADGAVVSMNEKARHILGTAVADGRPATAHAAEYRLRDGVTGRKMGPNETSLAKVLRGEIVSRADYLLRPPGGEGDVRLRTSALPIHGRDGVVAVLVTFAEMDDPSG